MTRRGRPLRFLGAMLGGWAVLRTGMLWPTLDAARDLVRAIVPPAAAAEIPPLLVRIPLQPSRRIAVAMPGPASLAPQPVAAAPVPRRRVDPARVALASASFLSFGREEPIAESGAVPPPLRPTPVDPVRRLTGSAWAILRDGGGSGSATGPTGGQLGGAQAGVRLLYALDAARRVALAGRVSTPLRGRGAEAAFGVELRPTRLPIRVVAERRVAIDGGRDGVAVFATGGIAPAPVVAGWRLEAYAQGGMVARRGGTLGFADGAARLTRAVSRTLDLGVGTWGGAQPGTTRVDVGPTIGVALPTAGRRLRLSIDWRQRVAGRARPGSGPAVSIGTDF